jgi:hypothetical protein
MHSYHAYADPPPTLADRLRRLNDNLQSLAIRLKEAIATAVSSTIGEVVRDLLRRFLGDQDTKEGHSYTGQFDSQPRDRYRSRFDSEERDWDYRDDDPWNEERQNWHEPTKPDSTPQASPRWNAAFRTAIQTALWWLRTQPLRRPVMTTTLVALAAGGTALFAGPTIAAGVSVIASVASLILTSDSVRSACGILTG